MNTIITNSIRPFSTKVIDIQLAFLMENTNQPELYAFAKNHTMKKGFYKHIVSQDVNGILTYNNIYDSTIAELN
jgi:hypothetical protein